MIFWQHRLGPIGLLRNPDRNYRRFLLAGPRAIANRSLRRGGVATLVFPAGGRSVICGIRLNDREWRSCAREIYTLRVSDAVTFAALITCAMGLGTAGLSALRLPRDRTWEFC